GRSGHQPVGSLGAGLAGRDPGPPGRPPLALRGRLLVGPGGCCHRRAALPTRLSAPARARRDVGGISVRAMAEPAGDRDTFPRQYARTQRLTLGEPRAFTVSPDGARIAFVRAASCDDPTHALWLHTVSSGEETCVADPVALAAAGGDL